MKLRSEVKINDAVESVLNRITLVTVSNESSNMKHNHFDESICKQLQLEISGVSNTRGYADEVKDNT